MKKILILNGSSRKNVNTAKLIHAFTKIAGGAGHQVKEFYLQTMNIKGCLGCDYCKNRVSEINTCVQKDNMDEIFKAFNEADIFVLASPVYFLSFSSQLKIALDRLYAYFKWGRAGVRQTVSISTAKAEELGSNIK